MTFHALHLPVIPSPLSQFGHSDVEIMTELVSGCIAATFLPFSHLSIPAKLFEILSTEMVSLKEIIYLNQNDVTTETV